MKWLLLFLIFTQNGVYGMSIKHPKKITLSNGLTVLLLQDKTLPYVRLELFTPMGSSKDPKDKQGLSYLTSKTLARGTLKQTNTELTAQLENLGTRFSGSVFRDYSSFWVDSLSWDFNSLSEIFSDILSTPVFAEKEIQFIKNQSLSKIKKLPETSGAMVDRVLFLSLFRMEGYQNPSMGYLKKIQNISKKDIQNHYKKYFTPKHSILGVSGQYPSVKIKAKLEKLFSKWENPSSKKKSVKEKNPDHRPDGKEPHFLIVHKKGQVQSDIRMGFPSLHRASPDYLAVQIANSILGGTALNSRLSSTIRVKHGLTYGIYSRLYPLMNEGITAISTSTRLAVTKESVDRILDTVEIFHKNGVTQKEIEQAKKSYKIQLLSSLQTLESRLSRQMFLWMYGLPYDLPSLNRNLKRLSQKDIHRAVKKYFKLENIVFIVYTDFDQVKDQFTDTPNLKIKKFNQFL